MLITVYIIFAIIFFFAQLKNGFVSALVTSLFWPVFIVGAGLFLIISIVSSSIKNRDPDYKLRKELTERGVKELSLIYASKAFREDYLPEDLQPVEYEHDGRKNYKSPPFDNIGDYLIFRNAIVSFYEDHDLYHQTGKGWYFERKEDPV